MPIGVGTSRILEGGAATLQLEFDEQVFMPGPKTLRIWTAHCLLHQLVIQNAQIYSILAGIIILLPDIWGHRGEWGDLGHFSSPDFKERFLPNQSS